MREDRLTFLLVPHGCDSPVSVSLSRRTLKALGSVAAAAGFVVLMSAAVLIAQMHGGKRLMAAGSEPMLEQELVALRARMTELQDTLEVIARRNQQIRVLAGLPEGEELARRISRPTLVGMLDDEPETATFIASSEMYAGGDIDLIIRRAADLATSFAEVADTLETKAERLTRIPSIMPTAGWLSSAFSRSRIHPILHVARPHFGIDVSAPMGAPIIAPAAGAVRRVARERGYGLLVEIDHGNGIVTRYAHCSRVGVKVGQRVRRGQEIAAVGSSGLSAGPHLHYEIHVNGRPVDPLTFVLPQNAITD